MVSRHACRDESQVFADAVAGLGAARVRPQVRLEETPAPSRIAPFAVALSAQVHADPSDRAADPDATGRFVVLYDPSGPEAWEGGSWRIVSFARAQLEPELGIDPMLGGVGWSWLTDALDHAAVPYAALGGTVTRVVSESFASLAHRDPTVEVEIRASWSPAGDDLDEQLRAWSELLCAIAGMPPLPSGVTPLPTPRR